MKPILAPDDCLLLVARATEQERRHRSGCRLSLRTGRSTPSPNGSTSPTTLCPPMWDLQTPSLSRSLREKNVFFKWNFQSSPVFGSTFLPGWKEICGSHLPLSKYFTVSSSWGQEQQTLTFLVTTVPIVQISNLADIIILARFYHMSYHSASLSILYALSSASHFYLFPAWDAAGCSWSLVVPRTPSHSILATGELFFKLKINKAMSKAEHFWNSHFPSKAVLTVLE